MGVITGPYLDAPAKLSICPRLLAKRHSWPRSSLLMSAARARVWSWGLYCSFSAEIMAFVGPHGGWSLVDQDGLILADGEASDLVACDAAAGGSGPAEVGAVIGLVELEVGHPVGLRADPGRHPGGRVGAVRCVSLLLRSDPDVVGGVAVQVAQGHGFGQPAGDGGCPRFFGEFLVLDALGAGVLVGRPGDGGGALGCGAGVEVLGGRQHVEGGHNPGLGGAGVGFGGNAGFGFLAVQMFCDAPVCLIVVGVSETCPSNTADMPADGTRLSNSSHLSDSTLHAPIQWTGSVLSRVMIYYHRIPTSPNH